MSSCYCPRCSRNRYYEAYNLGRLLPVSPEALNHGGFIAQSTKHSSHDVWSERFDVPIAPTQNHE